MDPKTSEHRSPAKSEQRANPLAVFCVLLIVFLSILLGVFGPRISDYRRGQYVSGEPVVDLLRVVPTVYFRERQEVLRSIRRSGRVPSSRDPLELEAALLDRFASIDPSFLPESSSFAVVGINDEVDLAAVRGGGDDLESAFAAFYLAPEETSDVDGGVLLLVRRLNAPGGSLHLRDEFGTPKLIDDGFMHRHRIDGLQSQLDLVFWILDGFFYVLATDDEDLLDRFMESLDMNPVIEDPISSV